MSNSTPEIEYNGLYLYLVEFGTAFTKVGVSKDPTRRIKQHVRDGEAFGTPVQRTWVSDIPHVEALENEAIVKGDSPREYLNRTFDDCLRQVKSLPMTQPTVEEMLQARKQGEAAFKRFKREFLVIKDALILIADLTSALQRTIDKMCDENDTIERAYRSMS